MLTRPSYSTQTNNPQEESDSPISDTETENSYTLQIENTKFSSLQDHAAYLTRPSAYSQPTSNAEKPYTSTHLTDDSTKLHKQSIVILEDEITSTPTRTCPILLPRPSKATCVNQQHPDPTTDVKPPQKSPLLPTPPAPVRNHHNQHISGPSASRHNTYSAFSRPSTFSSRKQYISRPHTPEFNTQQPPLLPRPSYQHQDFIPRPYQQHQQTQGHCTQQVPLPPYVPIIILTPYNQINNVLAQQTKLFNPNQQ